MKYNFLVDGTNLSCVGCEEVPTGNAGVLECEFAFASDPGLKYWYCSFRKAGKVRNVEIEGGRCNFGDDMLTKEGKLFIGVFGSNLENGTGFKRVSTNFVQIDVERGAYQAALGKVTPSLWEQYAEKVTGVEEKLDKLVLDHPDKGVTESKIADGAVSGGKIKDRAVGYEKLDFGVRQLMFKGEVNPAFMADELNDSSARGIYWVQDDYDTGPDGGASEFGDGLLIVQTREAYEESEIHLEGMWQARIKSNGVVMTREAKTIANDVVTEWREWSEPYLPVGAPTFKGDINVHLSSAYDALNTIEADGIYRTYHMDYTHNMRVTEGILIVSAELYPEGGLDYIRQRKIDSVGCMQSRESIKKEGDTVTEWSDWRGDYAVGEKGAMLFGTNVFDEEDIAIATDDNAFEVKKNGEVKSPTIEDLYRRTDAGFIVCSAEGEYICVNDSADLPMKGLSVLGKTKQLKSTGKNMIPFPYYEGERKEINGITFVVNDDGSITVKGSATADAKFRLHQDYSYVKLPLKVGSYSVSSGIGGKATGYNISIQVRSSASDTSTYLQSDYGSRTVTITSDTWIPTIDLAIAQGVTTPVEGVTIYPMLEKGTTPTGYEPYTNGIPSPSPELPQPMNSAGEDGSIKVEISNVYDMEIVHPDELKSQNMTVKTPNGLPGVPVNFAVLGGEKPSEVQYLDDKGQQWVCDEIDFDRGVYIKRIEEYTLELPYVDGDAEIGFYSYISPPFKLLYGCNGGLCDRGMFAGIGSAQFDITGDMIDFYFFPENYQGGNITTAEQVKELMDGAKMLLPRAEAIETPLPTERIEAYKKLEMYKPYTTISNDEGAYLWAEYIADTKSYIDNKFAELQTAIINNI